MIWVLLLTVVLAACSAPYNVPKDDLTSPSERIEPKVTTIDAGSLDAEDAGSQYRVRSGDTLLSIAWRFEQDPDVLKQRNQLDSDTILVGQSLKLKGEIPPKAKAKAKATTPPMIKAESEPNKATKEIKKPLKYDSKIQVKTISSPQLKGWQWPVDGPILKGYSENSRSSRSLQLGGRTGSSVRAAAAGRVVYAGDGLVGFGNLIIISHQKKLLSAYGHNQSLKVKVGDLVKAGEIVAKMGSTGTDRVKLHFEIRRQGTPINPLSLLPKRDL